MTTNQANVPAIAGQSDALDTLALVNHDVQRTAAGVTAVLESAIATLAADPGALVDARRLMLAACTLIEGNARHVQEAADDLGAGAADAGETAFLIRVAGGRP